MDTDNNGDFLSLSKPKFSVRRFLFYVITLAALILIYLKFSELRLIKELVEGSNYAWLIAIVAVQVLSYCFLAMNYREVLRIKDLEVGIKELFPVTFVIQFLNQALPSAGISGQAFFVQYLKKFGLAVSEGIGRAILELTSLYMAFGSFFIISTVIMWQTGTVGRHPEIKIFLYIFLFLALLALSLFFALQGNKKGAASQWLIGRLHSFFESRKKKKEAMGETAVNHAEHVRMVYDQFKNSLSLHVLKKHARAFWLAYAWQNAVLFLNFITLLIICYALGSRVNIFAAFVVFTLTRFLGMIAVVPGALGVFEGGMTLLFVSFGMPANVAFAVTLIYRAFTFWLPMPIGWLIYRYYSMKGDTMPETSTISGI